MQKPKSSKPNQASEARRRHALHKRLAIDVIGFGMIGTGIILSPVPGPGGIPLIIAGLAVLAQNYDWAHKLMQRIKDYLAEAAEKSFPKDPIIQRTYDILSPFFLVIGIVLLLKTTGRIWTVISIFIIFQGVLLFWGNRQRGQKLMVWFKRVLRR